MQTEIIYCSDNLKQLRQLPNDCIDLIYIDPPFGLTSDFDSWSATSAAKHDKQSDQIETYINWITPRIKELYRVLKRSGGFYIHCDSSNSAYLRVMIDRVFGIQKFRSHIIWRRAVVKHSSVSSFPNNHESILFYTKGDNYVYHQQYLPHNEHVSSRLYRFTEEATGRKYRLVDITRSKIDRPDLTYEFLGVTRSWKWSKNRMEQAYKEGLIVQTRPDAVPALKQYLDEQAGTPVDNVWLDIQSIEPKKEQLGYVTQQPLALLDRIIKTSSNEGDIVLDAFCGSGTTLHAAQNLGRRWIGMDINPIACRVAAERLERSCQLKSGVDFAIRDLPRKLQELHKYTPLEFESWVALVLDNTLKQKGEIAARIHEADKTLRLETYSRRDSSDKGFDFLIGDESKWIPVEIKQKSEIRDDDILSFRALLRRHNCSRGLFISFKFSRAAISRIGHLAQEEDLEIIPITVNELNRELVPIA